MIDRETPTGVQPHLDTFLPPIEKPQGLMMKLAYYFTRRQFGKVLTPLKVLGPARNGAISAGVGRRQRRQPRWRENPLAGTR